MDSSTHINDFLDAFEQTLESAFACRHSAAEYSLALKQLEQQMAASWPAVAALFENGQHDADQQQRLIAIRAKLLELESQTRAKLAWFDDLNDHIRDNDLPS